MLANNEKKGSERGWRSAKWTATLELCETVNFRVTCKWHKPLMGRHSDDAVNIYLLLTRSENTHRRDRIDNNQQA